MIHTRSSERIAAEWYHAWWERSAFAWQFHMNQYLTSSDTVDWQHPDVLATAKELSADRVSREDVARSCFEYVRDQIRHSLDHELNPGSTGCKPRRCTSKLSDIFPVSWMSSTCFYHDRHILRLPWLILTLKYINMSLTSWIWSTWSRTCEEIFSTFSASPCWAAVFSAARRPVSILLPNSSAALDTVCWINCKN